jgi:hypothetical protein
MTNTPNVNAISATSVIGTDVRNLQDENLGNIEEVMLDVVNGRVAYAVLSFGGFLGLGNKLFAIPWQALRYDPTESCYRLPVDKERLKNAPGFDKDDWPDTTDPTWVNGLREFYGVTD